MISASKLGINATKQLPGEGFKRPWPPLIKMDESVRRALQRYLGTEVTITVCVHNLMHGMKLRLREPLKRIS